MPAPTRAGPRRCTSIRRPRPRRLPRRPQFLSPHSRGGSTSMRRQSVFDTAWSWPRRARASTRPRLRTSFAARVKLDAGARVAVGFTVQSGAGFPSSWNNTGLGTGDRRSSVFLKHLFADVTPCRRRRGPVRRPRTCPWRQHRDDRIRQRRVPGRWTRLAASSERRVLR